MAGILDTILGATQQAARMRAESEQGFPEASKNFLQGTAEFVVPTTPEDIGLTVAAGPFGKLVKAGGLALAGLGYSPEAEAGLGGVLRGGGRMIDDILELLRGQGVDTSQRWFRGKRDPRTGFQRVYSAEDRLFHNPQMDIETAVALSRRPAGAEGAFLSRQLGDRGVTKDNTLGGVWLTDSPTVANTYSGDRGYTIPVFAPRPEATIDAGGQYWNDFFPHSRDWKELQRDPAIRSIAVRNVIDPGPDVMRHVPDEFSEDQIAELLGATNLFLKKPFDGRVVSGITGEPIKYARGGLACLG